VDYAVPLFSHGGINRAGKKLISIDQDIQDAPDFEDLEFFNDMRMTIETEYDEALEVVNNWRSAHSYPLNLFQMNLRSKVKQVDTQALVSQRIKRLAAIEAKLRRYPRMALAQMQDIGGCRAVTRSLRGVRRLVRLYEASSLRHKLRRKKDYILEPKPDGYRSIHLVYSYERKKLSPWQGLQIEIQIRSRLQHAWATAVETVGTFLRQPLKASQGDETWRRFFALMGSAMALRERSPLVPGTPTDRVSLVEELKRLVDFLQVETHLQMYGSTLDLALGDEVSNARYFLMELNANNGDLEVTGYEEEELDKAMSDYFDVEQKIKTKPNSEAVLVEVKSLKALRRAYPSFFLDSKLFLESVEEALAI
jgi:ppGpp synthetase/RelA/SpoT-type nucleotidyltranferase